MRIRSITALTNVTYEQPDIALAEASAFLQEAEQRYTAAGITVQTKRVATQPFPVILADAGPVGAVRYAERLQALAAEHGIDYVALGPVSSVDGGAFLEAIPAMIGATDTLFFSVNIADRQQAIDLAFVRRAAKVVQDVGHLTDDGLQNLFLAVTANCGPGAPFFPVAYQEVGAPLSFAVAVEAADIAVDAFSGAASVDHAISRLTAAVGRVADDLTAVAESLASDHGIVFAGLDISLAPYPTDAISLGGAMEKLGMTLGGSGGVASAAAIMTALDRATYHRVGFNGLMLPVLEDSVLARRASSGELAINDLLLYSAICGTGLDTLPLPGDTSQQALTGILLDTAALALRLNKPLTARLMPLPGKLAGESTGLDDFEFFAPGCVMAAPEGLHADGLLYGDGVLSVQERVPH